jgi:hypothetical protein
MAAAARHGNPPRRSEGLSGRGREDVAAQSYTVRYFDEPVSCFQVPCKELLSASAVAVRYLKADVVAATRGPKAPKSQ